ncbi:plant intracellular Ras-group-related LRR protein 4-like [Andrographis paniculata]|uniref:plant intracellular Ras-group-related LRR protein 4-like n=1 Tax=Andrographis paniculata TaxID=175694 RepID=UPI0021E82215|nr:plant intracellular Ras-group-related LRR protein 4-like [Andrographis paniculata]
MMMDLSSMTMDDAVEEVMRIHRSLPPRPGIDEVVAARTLIQNVEREDQLRLEAIAKQTRSIDVPEELFRILQEMQRNMIHFQSKEQRREAEKLLDLEGVHLVFDDLIQRASECIKYSYSRTPQSRPAKPSTPSPGTSNPGSTSAAFSPSSLSSAVQAASKSQSPLPMASSSFYNDDSAAVRGSKTYTSKDDSYLKTKPSFHGDGGVVPFGVRSKDVFAAPQIVDPTLKPPATFDEGDQKLSLIKLASLIEVSAKKGTRELLLSGKFSDQVEWLPDSIGKLSSLITLDLSENKISVLPDTIGRLSSLQTLDLHGNKIQELPESIGGLLSLLHLNLRGNQLTSLPASIGQLVRLQKLDLSSNGLTALPESIGLLEQLQIMNIETNDIEEIPHTIGRCASLKELHADYNRLKALPEAVGRIQSLEILTIRYNNIKQLPTTMASLSSLRQLDVSFNEIESIPESLCFATTLVKLDISNNFADLQSLPRSIGNLEMLEELLCHNNQIRVLPESFGMLNRLRVLNVEGNPLAIPPRDVIEKGAQAVVHYMAEIGVQKDTKPQPAKKKKPWANLWFFSKSNKRKRNGLASTKA